MSDLKVCRICLCKGVKVYNYDSFHLRQYYEEIMAKKVNEKDSLPNYFCYECAAILYKFHKFKEKCWTGENVLQELLWNGSITLSSISQIDRQDKNLQSSIGIITVSKRVRTHIIKTLSNGPIQEAEIPEQEIPEVEECKINYESDNSLDDKNLAEIKNEMVTDSEDEKPNIDIEESTDYKAMLDFEVDRSFSDDEDVWPDNTNDVDKPTIKEEVINEITVEEKTNLNTELDISEDEIVPTIKEEVINEITVEEKTNLNAELDISEDEIVPTIKEEVINEITVEEKTNLNTELDISEDEIVLNKNIKAKKRKKTKSEFRVRTHIIKHKTLSNGPIKEVDIKEVEIPEVEECKLNYESDNSLDDKTLAEIKNEMITEKDYYKEDEKVNIDIKNIKANKRKKAKSNKDLVNKKSIKIKVGCIRSDYLDPMHWLKINLTEEEALKDFRARAQNRKYVSAAFQCSDCYRGFSKEDMLNRHVKLRHSESLGPVECRFCKMRFKSKCYLTRHITQHYSKYKCLRCDLICPLKTTAVFHDEYHNGVIRKCIHCEEEFRHLTTYYTHLRTHRSEHVCTLCGASFVSTLGLNLHKRTMHINTVANPEEVNTYCEKCDVNFETRKAYDKHLIHSDMHTDGLEVPSYGIIAPSMPKLRKKLRRRNPRPCTICNRNFLSEATYLKHQIREHKDKPLPSTEEQRHICEICGVSLAVNSVASHQNTHTREKLYTCSTCDMQFNSKGSLNRHQLTHTGEKPFECSMCEKRFTQKCSMKLHYRTFHLKEPYPKRNRRKNAGVQQEIEDYRIHEEDS